MKPRFSIALVVAAAILAFFLLVSGVVEIVAVASSSTSRGLFKFSSVLGFLAALSFGIFCLIAALVLSLAFTAKRQDRGDTRALSVVLVALGAVFAFMQVASGLASMMLGISDNVSRGLINASNVLHSISGMTGAFFWGLFAVVLVMLLTTKAVAETGAEGGPVKAD